MQHIKLNCSGMAEVFQHRVTCSAFQVTRQNVEHAEIGNVQIPSYPIHGQTFCHYYTCT